MKPFSGGRKNRKNLPNRLTKIQKLPTLTLVDSNGAVNHQGMIRGAYFFARRKGGNL
jgi:hypothetical protein